MIIEKNNYFEEKTNLIESLEVYFKRHPLDAENIGRQYTEEVLGAEDTEQMVIADIILYHAIWKKVGALPEYIIERIKRHTNEIIQSNPTFTHLNAEEYKDFIKIVFETNINTVFYSLWPIGLRQKM